MPVEISGRGETQVEGRVHQRALDKGVNFMVLLVTATAKR